MEAPLWLFRLTDDDRKRDSSVKTISVDGGRRVVRRRLRAPFNEEGEVEMEGEREGRRGGGHLLSQCSAGKGLRVPLM